MSDVLFAARMGDNVGSHSSGWGAFWGLVGGLILGAIIAAVIIITAPVSLTILAAVAVGAGAVSAFYLGGWAGERLGEHFDEDHVSGSVCGAIKKGLETVFIENKMAARMTDPAGCSSSSQIKEGAKFIGIGQLPAARHTDTVTCTGQCLPQTQYTYLNGPKVASDVPYEETFASKLHNIGTALHDVGMIFGMIGLGAAALTVVVGGVAAGMTAGSIGTGLGAFFKGALQLGAGFGIFKGGSYLGGVGGAAIDSAAGYSDHRFEQFFHTSGGLVAGAAGGKLMEGGGKLLEGFTGGGKPGVEVLSPEARPMLEGPAARVNEPIEMVQNSEGVWVMKGTEPVGTGGPRLLEGGTGPKLLEGGTGPKLLEGGTGPKLLEGGTGPKLLEGGSPEPVAGEVAPTPRPSAEEMLANANNVRRASDQDAVFEQLYADGHPTAVNPEMAYSVIPDEALPGVLEGGLKSGRAFGKQGVNADNIWFAEGTPFYRDGIVLAIPKARLIELGGEPGVGLNGQKGVIRFPHDAAPEGIPIDEFAIGEVYGKGYVHEIYRPPGWKGEIGPKLPEVPKGLEDALGGGGGAKENACATCEGAATAPKASEITAAEATPPAPTKLAARMNALQEAVGGAPRAPNREILPNEDVALFSAEGRAAVAARLRANLTKANPDMPPGELDALVEQGTNKELSQAFRVSPDSPVPDDVVRSPVPEGDLTVTNRADPNGVYLYTVDQGGLNIAREGIPFTTPRGNVVHSNLSPPDQGAFSAGEMRFVHEPGAQPEAIINGGSGRYGPRSPEEWAATIEVFEAAGIKVRPVMPYNGR